MVYDKGMSAKGFNIGELGLENPLVLAPMAGITNLPFRLLAREHGAALVVTEMISGAGLSQGGPKSLKLMKSSDRERPVAVQLFGARPQWMARAAEIVQDSGADAIDLNMGCPARKVTRNGSGAALLKDFNLIAEIVSKVRQATSLPLTVKTRLGWSPDDGDILKLAPILADLGVDGLTLHARWASQGFSGQADWDAIASVVDLFPGPVIGNGDVTSPQAAADMLSLTGCAGVMIGRAALGNPWIFSQTLALLEGRAIQSPDIRTRFVTARRHAFMLGEQVGFDRAVFMLRSVLMWYTKGLPGSSAFRAGINRVRDFDLVLRMLDEYQNQLENREDQILEAVG